VGKTHRSGKEETRDAFWDTIKPFRANPYRNPIGEGLLLGEVSILKYRMVPRIAGNTKYCS